MLAGVQPIVMSSQVETSLDISENSKRSLDSARNDRKLNFDRAFEDEFRRPGKRHVAKLTSALIKADGQFVTAAH
jgi:hypothetical protein